MQARKNYQGCSAGFGQGKGAGNGPAGAETR